MPKVKHDWKAEYTDPVSDAEDAKQKEIEERQNAEIMAEIELCRRMEEDEEFAKKVYEENRRELELAEWEDDWMDELDEEEIEHTSRIPLP